MVPKGQYKAAFILPVPNEKVLGDAGWEFKTDKRLPSDTKKFLLEVLELKFVENSLGMSTYEGDTMKATIFFDDRNEVKEVYVRLYGVPKERLSLLFQASFISSSAELFFPSEG
ncbi:MULTISPECIES: hypothetical protein [Nitrosomonas]|uniref:hypothetical protein n=1 Tax=Nitrosomonas TaxID=914 RepID=UPI00059B714A|nr:MULTISPECIES: hypothetical protein [Nitrosomonas]SDW43850.1 hypothetical protein SAMN05216310_1154 [Nitrosomonas europaea]SET05223.1 hypothetical protein SAMN05216309_1164 [Nitrosomonas europaea]SJZ57727.1 hypothetical protein SAMN02745113_01318 [Nitrosomonas europaea]HBF25087.1 hypothetical protein [Nitrosomonas sp.]